MKIIDDINKRIQDERVPFYSFEYFPPKTDKGVENLYERLERMALLQPAWIDVTWGAGGSTSRLTHEICHNAQNYIGLNTMMHMTCTNMPKEELRDALVKAKQSGIRNILALRGDPPRGEDWKQIEGGFAHAVDLVRYIRQEFGSYFGICVSGYPEGHVDAVSYEEDLQHLKEKIDAGADLVITQLFYDTDIFLKFVSDCRALGIRCPILPGIMPIHGYAGFSRMTSLCKTIVPEEIRLALEPIKNDDEAVKSYGVKLAIKMCRTMLDAGVPGLHFYTLNLEKSIIDILEGLQLLEQRDMQRPLPWETRRANEDVRPIFWSHRPRSYVERTASWDEFPNGRWGDSRSPAFGDLTDYHLANVSGPGLGNAIPKGLERGHLWGLELASVQDVYDVFTSYCKGEIAQLPWYNTPLAPESLIIKDTLVKLNKMGFLTINSQPRVNGALSTDEKVGWGPKGGYVYQKAYLEFFTSPENLNALINACKRFPSITYHAVNFKNQSYCNVAKPRVTAVTWGVFPNKEIVQPTVVDPDSFLVWKDEAFGLWKSQWAMLYDEGSTSRNLVEHIMNNYFLVNMVDNNFVDGDIFALFENVQPANAISN